MFQDKVVVVTGGAMGIGRCICEEFEKAGFITGENICIDGGMTKLMIYHNDHGWNYEG